jgi:esterase/lipase superfamily enzyme
MRLEQRLAQWFVVRVLVMVALTCVPGCATSERIAHRNDLELQIQALEQRSREAEARATEWHAQTLEAESRIAQLQQSLQDFETRLMEIQELSREYKSSPPDGWATAEPPEAAPDRPEVDLGNDKGYTIMEIHYGTDRAQGRRVDQVQEYENEPGTLRLGVCHVSIPKRHEAGCIEAPWRFLPENPAKHVSVLDAFELSEPAFLESLKSDLGRWPGKQMLLFVHGFNVTFEEAAHRTAQLTYDLGFDGAAAMYSWPSIGDTEDYFADRLVATDVSPARFAEFLKLIARQSGADKIHIIAHSMGNEVLCRAMDSLEQESGSSAGPRFGYVVLAAPDVDRATFKDKYAQTLVQRADKVILYASSRDKALEVAERIHANRPRAGSSRNGVTFVKDIDTIIADDFHSGILYHSYYAETQSIIYDLIAAVRMGYAPDKRCLVGEVCDDGPYWKCVRTPEDACQKVLLEAIAAFIRR